MMKSTSRSVTSLALSLLVGATYSLPTVAQVTQSPKPGAAPINPNPQPIPPLSPTPASPAVNPSTPVTRPEVVQPGVQAGDAYSLGAGDIVRVDIFDITPAELALEQRYTILLDGTLNLPWVGSVPVQGLTLKEAGDVIAARYARFIKNPVITISLLAPRPLKVGVIGEVNRPGSYIISVISNEVTQTSLNQRTASEGGNQWPRVSQAIQTAGGITQLANLREIKVKRARGNTEELVAIDLFRFLREGDQGQDILLRDGDTIVIPKATQLDSAEAYEVAQSNFSPDLITVNVVGEVFTPGARQVKPNTTLNQAILAAGGLRGGRASSKKIDLIRLNPNGTISRRRLNIDLDQNMNDERNPRLFNNDIVVVNRTFIASVNDFLQTALGVPLTIFGGISGFRNLLPNGDR
jgi:polysaccharide biosynthesis/export protein